MYTVHTTIVTCAKPRGSCLTYVTAGYYADFVKQIKALTVQLSPKICSVKMAVP